MMDITRQYLDEVGAKHIVDTVKSLIKNINPTVDLSDYATTKQLTDAIKAIDLSGYITKKQLSDALEGVTGGTGIKGDDGVGISNVKLVNYELIVTLTDGTEHNLGNVRGEKGADGQQGIQGEKGEKGDTGAKGADGTNGVSPTITVTETATGHTITITDVNGTQSFEVLNGKDGSSSTGGSTDAPTTEKGKSAISGSDSLRLGSSKSWTGTFTTANGDAVSDVTGVWTISDCTFVSDITKTIDGNKITLKVDNDNDVGGSFTLNFADADGKYEPSSQEISIVDGF